ncbi:MAG TPA: hypothetical protein VNE39_05050 [Planctomycetota bacterium]|nr:hypothetical protein [Planctomycetota bacterium]
MTPRRLFLLIGGSVLAVALPLAVNPSLHLRADAMSNTALAHAVRRHGLPPPDPYLAGQPLQYHWGYNAAVAGLSALTGLDPLPLMVWLGPVALGVVLVAGARIVRRAGGSNEGAALAALLALVGLNGWGWGILAVRWAAGEASSAASLDGGVSSFLPLMVCGYDVRLAFFATKALVATSFIWCLALVAVAVGALARLLCEGGWRHGAVFALAAAGASCATAHVGAGLLMLALAWLAIVLSVARRRPELVPPRRPALALGFVGVGLALFVPYLVLVSGGAAARERLAWAALPDASHLLGAAAGLAPLAACVAVVGRPTRWRIEHVWLWFLAAGFAAAFLVVRVVDGVETKFLFVAAMLLAFYVGSLAGELTPRRRRLLWLVAASAVPTTLLGLVAYARAPDTIGLSRSEAAAFDWIARNAPPDAVVVARERSTLVPILARRDLYVPDRLGFHRAARYDPAVWQRRTEQMRRLFDRGEVAAVLDAIAAELRRPVLLLARASEMRVDAPRLRPLFSAGDIQVLRLEGPHEAP